MEAIEPKKWNDAPPSYEDYLKLFDALSNPMRIRILGILSRERQYVSELARRLNISRPLLYMHLRKLEEAGLVTGSAEISSSGKANKYFQAVPFSLALDSALIASLEESIPLQEEKE